MVVVITKEEKFFLCNLVWSLHGVIMGLFKTNRTEKDTGHSIYYDLTCNG